MLMLTSMRIEWVSDIQVRRMELATLRMSRITNSLYLSLRGHTLPTELMFAGFARHMVASISLLNPCSAAFARTLFRDFVNHLFGCSLFVSSLLTGSTVIVLLAGFTFVPCYFVLQALSVAAMFTAHEVIVADVKLTATAVWSETPGELFQCTKCVTSYKLVVCLKSLF